MLVKQFREPETGESVRIRKQLKNAKGDASCIGAFPFGVSVEFCAEVPRRLGCAAVVMRINRDGEPPRDLPLSFSSTCNGTDEYRLTLDTRALCAGEEYGLFYYEFLFVRGADTLFTDSVNNVDFRLSAHSAAKFRLLVYEEAFHTPEWFRRGTMYHVFVDRFCRGSKKIPRRKDAEYEEDWVNGIPQYAKKPGDPLKNNRFFGGTLWGVAEKLDYLSEMGVTVLYLSPVFRAYSNHKYDTGDYETVDPQFGGEAALTHLIGQAKSRGIRIILDGVFNHTGDDSKYFNRYGKYPNVGAYQSPDSPYHDWFCFRRFPEEYESWWGISILPKLNHTNIACRRYFTGEDGIIAKYLKLGIGGWRLDVADELSDEFLDELRETAKAVDPEAEIIGEVWENAADKIAYGKRRRYFSGRQLDSVMNYPVRNAILAFARDGDAQPLYHTLTELYSSYPREVSDSLMNLLGTHDTVRILTALGSSPEDGGLPNAVLARKRLTGAERTRAKRLLKIASAVQFTVFGIPSVYYGDEAGLEGYHDPFCRMPYPWGREDAELMSHYRRLGEIRKLAAFDGGDFRILGHGNGWIAYERKKDSCRVVILANRSDQPVTLEQSGRFTELLTGSTCTATLTAEPDTVCIWEQE